MTKVLQAKLTHLLRAKKKDRRKLKINRQQMRGTEIGLVAEVPLERRAPLSQPRMGTMQRKIASHDHVAGLRHVAPKQAGPQALDGADPEVVPNGILHSQGKALHQITQCTLAVLHPLNRRMMLTIEHNDTMDGEVKLIVLNFCF